MNTRVWDLVDTRIQIRSIRMLISKRGRSVLVSLSSSGILGRGVALTCIDLRDSKWLAVEVLHRVRGLTHVVVLAPFAHAYRQVRSLQLHDQARPVAPHHVVDLAVSLDRRCPQNVSNTLAHEPACRLGSATVCRSMCL